MSRLIAGGDCTATGGFPEPGVVSPPSGGVVAAGVLFWFVGLKAEVIWSVPLESSGTSTAKSLYDTFGPVPRLVTSLVIFIMSTTRSEHPMSMMVAFPPGVAGGLLFLTLPDHRFSGSFGFSDRLMTKGSFESFGALCI